MAIFRGKRLTIEIYGESHADEVGARVQGMPAMTYDSEALVAFMARRKASNALYSTHRTESDLPLLEGATAEGIEGDFTVRIANANVRSGDYAPLYGKPRPGHADYAWYAKDGTLDFAGGGRFSARLTAPLTAVGGLCKQYLESKGIRIDAYVAAVGNAKGVSYKDADFDPAKAGERERDFPSLGGSAAMLSEIAAAKADLDSVGGRVECVVRGLPAGIGDNLFEGLEGKIASLVYAIPAVKGVEFGDGFDLAATRGSISNDPLYYDEAGNVCFGSDRQGGINGGISNGNVLTLGVAFKPTPSIAKEQHTVDLVSGRNVTISIEGRHDACVVPRAVPVVEAAVAIALVDEMTD